MKYRYTNQASWTQEKQLEIITNEFTTRPLETEGWRNLHASSLMLRGYNQTFPEKFDLITLPTGELCVEKPFAAFIGVVRGIKLIYMGKIDLAYREEGNLFVHDFKTSSVFGESFWANQSMAEQYRGYAWGFRECTSEEPTGYVVTCLVTRESVTNASFDELLGRVVPGTTANGKESKAVPIEFGRQRFFTIEPPGQLDEWRENFLLQADTFLYQAERGQFAKHHKHCVGKYGPCPYYHVDELPERSRLSALQSGAFEEVTWSPLNK